MVVVNDFFAIDFTPPPPRTPRCRHPRPRSRKTRHRRPPCCCYRAPQQQQRHYSLPMSTSSPRVPLVPGDPPHRPTLSRSGRTWRGRLGADQPHAVALRQVWEQVGKQQQCTSMRVTPQGARSARGPRSNCHTCQRPRHSSSHTPAGRTSRLSPALAAFSLLSCSISGTYTVR